jgi:hypothetical protein
VRARLAAAGLEVEAVLARRAADEIVGSPTSTAPS